MAHEKTELFLKIENIVMEKLQEAGNRNGIDSLELIEYIIDRTQNGENITDEMIETVLRSLVEEYRIKISNSDTTKSGIIITIHGFS